MSLYHLMGASIGDSAIVESPVVDDSQAAPLPETSPAVVTPDMPDVMAPAPERDIAAEMDAEAEEQRDLEDWSLLPWTPDHAGADDLNWVFAPDDVGYGWFNNQSAQSHEDLRDYNKIEKTLTRGHQPGPRVGAWTCLGATVDPMVDFSVSGRAVYFRDDLVGGETVGWAVADYNWGDAAFKQLEAYYQSVGKPPQFTAAYNAVKAAHDDASSVWFIKGILNSDEMKAAGEQAVTLRKQIESWAAAQGKAAAPVGVPDAPPPKSEGLLSFIPWWVYGLVGVAAIGVVGYFAMPLVVPALARRSAGHLMREVVA